ncbi:MAG TPA: beta-ketoacyl-ACP synthase II [Anaerolineales bacterium]|nr:beta-ketoacyl-ACP synthase II [Anaerolineales bacterium]
MESRPRIVVTGMGVISPVGLDSTTMWQNLIAGRSGIGPITLFDTHGYDVHIAGEAHNFDPLQYMSARDARRMDRYTQFARAALEEALAQSHLEVNEHNAYEIGVIVGSATGGAWTWSQGFEEFRLKGPHRLNPFYVTAVTVDASAVHIALRTGARGPSMGVSTACASGAEAIGQAYETIRRGHARAMLAGGFDAAITPLGIASFDQIHALSHRNDQPEAACRPFDADRDGFVAAEGGALLVLEDLEFASERGAQPLAEVLGYATTSDAVHLTAPDPDGASAAHCMRLALQRTGVAPQEVSYINAHGTGTCAGDIAETRAIQSALGVQADRVPASATKSMTGHLMGGAGALEAVICIQALRMGYLPPTINLDTPDPQCNLDYVPHKARQAELEVVLSNSFGFGGHNATLVFRSFR